MKQPFTKSLYSLLLMLTCMAARAATLLSVTPPMDAYYRAGQALTFTVHYDENVTVTGTTSLQLNVGGVTRYASYLGGSGSQNLQFAYIVANGDNDQDGITLMPQIRLDAGSTIKDAFGLDVPVNFTAPALGNVRVKTDRPIVAVTMAEASPINHPFTVTFTFSDPVTGFDNSDLTISGLSLTPVTSTDGGKTWTATVTSGFQGPCTITLPADRTFDVAGNGNQTGSLNFSFDNITPVLLSVTAPGQYYKAGDPLTFTATYSEAVQVAGNPYIEIIAGATTRQATFSSGSGTTQLKFTYTVAAGDLDQDGPVASPGAIQLNGGTIKDAAQNNGGLTFGNSYGSVLIDAVPPVINSVTTPNVGYAREGDLIILRINTSESVTISGTPRLGINMGGTPRQAVYVNGSGSSALVFVYNVVAGDDDNNGIQLDPAITLSNASIRDAAGNNIGLTLNGVQSMAAVLVNTTHPTVTITSAAPAIVNGAFTVNITFSEFIPGNLSTAGVSSVNATFSGLNTTNNITWTGLITPPADMEAAASFRVLANAVNNLGGNGNLASGLFNYTIDTRPPVINSITPPGDDLYKAGEVLTYKINYNDNMVVTGTPTLPVIIGSTTHDVPLTSYAANILTFSYTVTAGDVDADGVSLGTAIGLNGGTIKDDGGNNAPLAVSGSSANVLVEAVPPAITAVEVPGDDYYNAGRVLNFRVHTSEPVTITGTPALGVNIGGVIRQAALVSGAGSNLLEFSYTIVPGDNDMNGIQLEPNLLLNGSTITDGAGNPLALALNSVAPTGNIFVNTNRPSVTVSTTAAANVNAPFPVTVTFSEIVSGFTLPDLRVFNATTSALQVTGNGTYTLLVTPVTDGEVSVDVPAVVAVNIASNTNTASNMLKVTYDGTTPVVYSVALPPAGTYKAGDVLNFTVNYSEQVTVNTTGGNPTLPVVMASGNKVADYSSGSGTSVISFKYTVQAGDLDADGIGLTGNLQLNGGTIRDIAGNNASLALFAISPNVVQVDAVAPTITSVNVPFPGYYKNGDDFGFLVMFSEDVTVTGTPSLDVVIGGVTRQAVATSAGTANRLYFSYTVQPGDQDLNGIEPGTSLNLNGAVMQDAAGNNLALALNGVANTDNVFVHSGVPAVTFSGIVVNAPFTLNVIFSEAVTGFDITDILVTNATLSNFNTTDNTTYTLLLTPIAQGTVTLKVPANAAVNIAGTANTATSNISYYYDGTAPFITSVDVPADRYYKAGDVLNFTVHYSENVNLVNTTNGPLLPVIIGSNTVNARYTSGGGTNGNLVFTYTIADGDTDLDGITLGSALSLNGSTMRDANTNNADLTINNPANSSQVRVNTARPSVTITSAAATRVNAAFTATITFSEAVTGFAFGDIVAGNGTLSNLQTSDNITYTVTITPGTDGTVTINVPAVVAVNNAGNDNTASNTLSRTVDKTGPAINAAAFNVDNNAAIGTPLGQLTATDAGGTVQNWAITTDGSGGAFAMDANGNITVKDAALLDAKAGTTVTLNVTVSDDLNNSSAAAIPIKVILAYVNKTPTLDVINNVSICANTNTHTMQLTGASAVENGQTYTITTTADQPYFDDLSVNTAGVLSYKLKSSVTSGTAIISVTIKDNGGIANGAVDQLTRSFTITVNNLPTVSITSDKGATISKGDVVHLTATGGSSYVWSNLGQQGAVLEARVMNNTTYEVTATNAAGCSNTASINIAVVEDFKVDATNVMTPNGDGVNDKWVIKNIDSYLNNEVQVFDRAGREVFRQRNYNNTWDGTLNGQPLAEGTYYYILRINNDAKTAKGFITIIRNK